MPQILAHRGNINGPCAATENRASTIQAALECGWGVELDMRRASDGRFYVSHDPAPTAKGLGAEEIFSLIRAYPSATIAVNVKELGYEAALLEFLDRHGVLSQAFLFDMELIEPRPGATARAFRRLHRTVRIAARVSDRGEPLDRALAMYAASVIWLDEFDRPWCTEADIRRLKASGRTVYAVSPDLHQFPLDRSRERWIQFCRWGVDGICTDYPEELQRVLAATCREPA